MLAKFSYPKNSKIESFKPQKILPSSSTLEIRSTPLCIQRDVRIKRVEFRENVRAFFLQGQGKLVRNNEVSV